MEATGKDGEAPQLTKRKRDSTDHNAMNCPMCVKAFDNTIKRPRTLPCGHTLCTPCLNDLIKESPVRCPVCHVAHTLPKAGNFPITCTIEALLKRQKGGASASPPVRSGKHTGKQAASPVAGLSEKDPASLKTTIRSLVQEQEAKVLAAIRTSKKVLSQLDQYKTTLVACDERQKHFQNRLQTLMDRSKNARRQMQQEVKKVTAKTKLIQRGQQQLDTLLETLRKATIRSKDLKAIDDAEHRTEEERERTKECQAMMPDLHTVTTIREMIVISRTVLKAVEKALDTEGVPEGAVGGPSLPTDSASTITERFQNLLTPTLKAEDLRSLTASVRTLLEADLVFASHEVNGHSRHAQIRLEDGLLHLYSLRDQDPPLGAAVVQVDEVVPPSPPCLVFLDLAWPGTARRRVLLRLNRDTPMGRQFILLCTGQRGHCYANTELCSVMNKGKPGEYVVGGDYDATGGPALLADLGKGRYRKSGKAGAVAGVGRDGDYWNALFAIKTRNEEKGKVFSPVFGKVEKGLDVVAAAAHHFPITEVTVVDCGVML